MPISFATPAPNDPLFAEVFDLGESQSRTVGMLPRQAWREYGSDGRLLAAYESSLVNPALLGYAAFRLPRSEVALAHLVVKPEHRGQGVARALTAELTNRYGGRRGIGARCRRDYEVNEMWPHLGFVPLGSRPGRSTEGHLLTYWWRDHGHADLTSWSGAPEAVTSVVIDANIFLDLHSEVNADQTTRTVLRDLEDRIELLITPELHNEIDRQHDSHERERLHRCAQSYPRLPVSPVALDRQLAQLIAALGGHRTRRQDTSDLRQIAYAAAAGIRVVVTRDAVAQRRLGSIAADVAGISMLSPHELVVHIDRLQDAPSYWPVALLRTGFQVREASVDDSGRLAGFLNNAVGERRAEFNSKLNELAQRRPQSHRLIYLDPTGEPVALIGSAPRDTVLEVPLLRLLPGVLASTLAAQIAAQLRPLATRSQCTAIRITDPYPDPLLQAAALDDGFAASPSGAIALTIDQSLRIADLELAVTSAATHLTPDEQHRLRPIREVSELNADALARVFAGLERRLRPARIVDAPLDTWLTPIKPAYAMDLFGYPANLFDQPDELGISVEHVYYRKGRSGETAPARVIWYVSGHGEVIASSELIEVIDAPPSELHRRFRRLGVYNEDEVRASVGAKGTARALRVINTQIFDNPLPLQRLKDLAQRHRQGLQLQSMSRINAALYEAIIRETRGVS